MNAPSRLLSLSAGLCGLLAVAADPFSEMAYLEVQPAHGVAMPNANRTFAVRGDQVRFSYESVSGKYDRASKSVKWPRGSELDSLVVRNGKLELTTKDPGSGSMTFEVRVRVGSALGVKGAELEGYAYFTNWRLNAPASDSTCASELSDFQALDGLMLLSGTMAVSDWQPIDAQDVWIQDIGTYDASVRLASFVSPSVEDYSRLITASPTGSKAQQMSQFLGSDGLQISCVVDVDVAAESSLPKPQRGLRGA